MAKQPAQLSPVISREERALRALSDEVLVAMVSGADDWHTEAAPDLGLDAVRLAVLCQRAENTFVGVNCGILDQYTSAAGRAGHVLLLDCRHLTGQATAIDPGVQVVICDTRFKRELSGSEYAERRAQCEEGAAILARHYPEIRALRDATLAQLDTHANDLPDVVRRRARFIIEEPPQDPNEAVALYNRIWDMAIRAAIREGGVINEHHGVGLKLGRIMRDLYGPAFNVLESLKKVLDPNNIMNPGKMGFPGKGV